MDIQVRVLETLAVSLSSVRLCYYFFYIHDVTKFCEYVIMVN